MQFSKNALNFRKEDLEKKCFIDGNYFAVKATE